MRMEDFLKHYPINSRINVAWGEMDALQHVNNVVYFKYFEIARIDFLSKIKLLTKETMIGPVISENQAKYKFPVTFPDTLTIGVTVSDIESDRFILHYTAFSEKQQKIATTGWSKVVMFNFKTGKKAPLTTELINTLHQHEQ